MPSFERDRDILAHFEGDEEQGPMSFTRLFSEDT